MENLKNRRQHKQGLYNHGSVRPNLQITFVRQINATGFFHSRIAQNILFVIVLLRNQTDSQLGKGGKGEAFVPVFSAIT